MHLSAVQKLKVFVPPFLRPWGRALVVKLNPAFKYEHSMGYWDAEYAAGNFDYLDYEKKMLALAGQPDDSFLVGKVVADFGCGPMGTLMWAKSAKARIGIDVTAVAFSRYDIRAHNMIYVESTERRIPLPDNSVDILYTINALDHTNNLQAMCDELVRILAPGGILLASFNLGEEPTFDEPQTLSEAVLDRVLLNRFDVTFRKVAAIGPINDAYRYFYDDTPEPAPPTPTDGTGFLWVRARKK